MSPSSLSYSLLIAGTFTLMTLDMASDGFVVVVGMIDEILSYACSQPLG